jgi:biotin operon repressor
MRDDLTAQYVLTSLKRGKDAAQSIGELSEALRLPRRAVEASVQALRLEGWPVCSDGSGVWLGDRADLTRCIASLQRRVANQYLTLRALRRARDRMVGEQLVLFDAA